MHTTTDFKTTGDYIARLDGALKRPRGIFLSNRLFAAMAAGRVTLAAYKMLLRETYHFVKFTVPHLELAAERIRGLDLELAEIFYHHAKEELGHDRWALEDLAALGEDPAATRRSDPLPHTAALVAYQYDTIVRGNPKAILGLEYAMEGVTAESGGQGIAFLKKALTLPDNALRFFTRHVTVDAGHVESDRDIITRFILTPVDQAAVLRNAGDSLILYGAMYDGICAETGLS